MNEGRGFSLSRFLRAAALIVFDLVLVAAVVWGSFLLWYQLPGPGYVKGMAIALWAGLGVAAILLVWSRQHRWRVLAAVIVGFIGLLFCWSASRPSHDRVWADDVARLLHAEVRGSHVILDNVRNFEWRTESDYTPRWETREYDLERLVSADMFLSYWMGPAIAHTLISFGFDDGRHLVFSLEIRKERGESFSAIAGFFRQFESVLIAAEESDIVRTRSNVRLEDVYLYRLDLSNEVLRELFLSYVKEAQALESSPRFYNTLTSNCTTVVFQLARQVDSTLPFDIRLLASGYLAGYAKDLGLLSKELELEQLSKLGYINARAQESDHSGVDFSTAIRLGVPDPRRSSKP